VTDDDEEAEVTKHARIERAKTAKLAEIARHYRPREKKKFGKKYFGFLRMQDLEKLFLYRYGGFVLPDDDSGHDDLIIALHHLAQLPGDPEQHIRRWCSLWAPWMPANVLKCLVAKVIANPKRWSADGLAKQLGLTFADRMKLGIRTIGSIDVSKAERDKRRAVLKRERDRRYQRRKRVAKSLPASSLTRSKPWLGQGISRATWYRRKAQSQAKDTDAPG
jgi:hypothetical protein